MSDAIVHRHTPTLQVCDPSGAPVRSVAYYRRTAQEHAKPRVTASASRRAGRVSQQWDPRLFALSTAPTADTANLTGLSSLSGRPLLTESVDAGWRVQFWGAAGELQLAWDGRGTRTRHTYDAIQRPIAVFEQCQDAPECCIGLTAYGTQAAASVALNQCGQPVRVDDSAGSRQVHGYSLQGAPLAETRHFLQALAEPDWPQAVAQRDALLEPEGATTRWGYDALGALLQQTDAQGNSQYTDYNIAGQITGTRLQLCGQAEQTLIRDITYNAFGQITAETAGNGVTTRATYRADTGVLLGLRAQRPDKTWLQDLRYAYDPVGNVLSITDATQSVRHFANARIEPVNNYAYDTLSQLIRATGREVGSSGYGPELRVSADPTQLVNYTQTYHYDTAGNLHTLQHSGAQSYMRKMQAAEHSNRSLARKVDDPLLNAGEFSAGFDANGNVQHLQPGQVLLWDGRNQLCQVTPVARDEGADDTERYVYDGVGQRLRKVRISQAKNVAHIAQVRYLPGLEIREDSATGEILHVITVQSPGRSSVRVLRWVTDTPIGVSNNQLRFGLGDHLGSSSLELDSEAQLVSQEGYYPYGGTAWWAASNRTEVKYKTVRYSGKERDATGLYYYGFRYYAPCWGRWLNPDPAGTMDGFNLFRMVRNNPVTLYDKDGLVSINQNFDEQRGDMVYGLGIARGRYISDALGKPFSSLGQGAPPAIIDLYNNAVSSVIVSKLASGEISKICSDPKKYAEKISVPLDLQDMVINKKNLPLWESYFSIGENNKKFNINNIYKEVSSSPGTSQYHEWSCDLTPKLLWKRGSKLGIAIAASGVGNKIHFVLDKLEMSSVVNKQGDNGQSITASELRYAYRNRENLKGLIHFYKDNIEVCAPWDTDSAMWGSYKSKVKNTSTSLFQKAKRYLRKH